METWEHKNFENITKCAPIIHRFTGDRLEDVKHLDVPLLFYGERILILIFKPE